MYFEAKLLKTSRLAKYLVSRVLISYFYSLLLFLLFSIWYEDTPGTKLRIRESINFSSHYCLALKYFFRFFWYPYSTFSPYLYILRSYLSRFFKTYPVSFNRFWQGTSISVWRYYASYKAWRALCSCSTAKAEDRYDIGDGLSGRICLLSFLLTLRSEFEYSISIYILSLNPSVNWSKCW